MAPIQIVLPFLVTALAGAVLAFFELLGTFQRVTPIALRSKWGLILLGINALSAVIVYAIARYVLNLDGGIWMALVIGLVFPTILRSRFTFYRQAGKKGEQGLTELSLKLDEFYRTLQDWCYTEVNDLLAEHLDAQAEAIKQKYTAKELEDRIRNRIASGPMLAKRQEHEQRLEEILTKHKDDVKRRHHALALFLIEISTPEGIRTLTR